MTLVPPIGRPRYRSDLTRWNRAGLTRFQYVDGNAPVWLEELRLGMLALFLRGIDPEHREPEKWRDLFMKPVSDWDLPTPMQRYVDAVAWAELLPAAPTKPENASVRNRRLVDQYGRPPDEYAWEIMRAFARAAHVLLGHADAYANEGYLRTATQWDNLRKLAAMVNYQPAPPASATATVALEIASDTGVIEIARGLAMKYAAPEGGAPLIFETLKPLEAHPALNRARAAGWNVNPETLPEPDDLPWIVPDKTKIAQGDVAVLGGWQVVGFARLLRTIEPADEGTARITFEPPTGLDSPMAQTFLYVEPEGVRLGLPETAGAQLVIKAPGATQLTVNAVVEVVFNNGAESMLATVASVSGDQLVLSSPKTATGPVKIEAFSPVAANPDGKFETPHGIQTLHFANTASGGAVLRQDDFDVRMSEGKEVAHTFAKPAGAGGNAFARMAASTILTGNVVTAPTFAIPAFGATVRFAGKPPKRLREGDWYVARPVAGNQLTALKVVGVRIEADVHHVLFCPAPPLSPERMEFFGPMTKELRPLGFDRNPRDAIVGGVCELEGLPEDARDLVKPGKTVLVINEQNEPKRAASATVLEAETLASGNLRLTLDGETSFAGWQKGWTVFCLNTATISHGETKDPKALGSGDAEKRRQDFLFKADTVSFIPSNVALTGVAPDMDVAVDGVKWEYRDLTDPLAEETDSWSVRLNADDTLQVHFRRRLPTGTNNITVPRHRVGSGLAGTGVPPWSFTAPMKKNRFVTAIVQPFATAGGADREPVAAIRENAPANLAANGRAVSLRDFERLCARHASVWQAKARQIIGPQPGTAVEVVIVPAGGGAVTGRLAEDLTAFVRARALPATTMTVTGYLAVPVTIAVTIFVDIDRYEKTDVLDGVAGALLDTFSLQRRGLGQPLYIAELLAACERVEGVSAAVVDGFARKAGAPEPLREAMVAGALAAIFPREDQVVHLAAGADLAVLAEASV
jgi:Baseplate J-like protein